MEEELEGLPYLGVPKRKSCRNLARGRTPVVKEQRHRGEQGKPCKTEVQSEGIPKGSRIVREMPRDSGGVPLFLW